MSVVPGTKRREIIMTQLAVSDKPISASRFAQKFGVSRQIIVGDIALLRAAGENIIATARGYLLEQEEVRLESKVAVAHDSSRTEEELQLIIENGGEVVDVIVDHPLYGELVGGLHLKTQADITAFLADYQKNPTSLLSQLTGGIHLHTIRYQREQDLINIKAALSTAGILYQAE